MRCTGIVGGFAAGVAALLLVLLAVLTSSTGLTLVVGGAVLDDVDEGRGAVVLDRGGGYEDDVVEGLDQQTGVDELIGEELVAGIVEGGAELERPGGGVDLVIEGGELAGLDLSGVGAVVGVHRECVLFELGLNLREVVFGDVEDDGDGLELGDDGEGRG